MDHLHGAQGAGPSTPTSDETSTAGTVRGLGGQGKEAQLKYARPALAAAATTSENWTLIQATQRSAKTSENRRPTGDDAASHKLFATLQAEAALRGHRVDRITLRDGSPAFLATRWGLIRELRSLEELGTFVRQIGGRHVG